MSINSLQKIYSLFSLWAEEFEFACHKGCSTCCTQSVTMTTLEGELILDYIKSEKPELLEIIANLPSNNFNPATTNEFAAACLNEKTLDESPGWNMTPCVFLQDNCCSIYPVRPFMCRSLGSQVPCNETGEAEMEPLFLTLNTVIMQCIEHLDQGRPWGNMYAILKTVSGGGGQTGLSAQNDLGTSRSIPGFLIPPDEMDQVKEQLHTLLGIIKAQ